MDTAQWPQGIGVAKDGNNEKKPRPQKDQALNCPRCASTNTKFCYYNNYSLSQPRYFCKTCRRYWTDGGSLRSVPVGGGSRKNRRSTSSAPSSKKQFSDPTAQNFSPQNPKIHEGQDLNLAYNPSNGMSEFVTLPFGIGNSHNPTQSQHFPFFKTGNFTSLMAESTNSVYSQAGFAEFKPSLGFSVDEIANYGNNSIEDSISRRVSSFPFEELKQDDDQTETGERNGYWNGVITGGSW
ncbi:hypothetical protein ACS0TY_000160 [Phlomoides rotata]